MKNRIPFLAIALAGSLAATAQTNFRQTAEASVTIAGTSTMHDWTMTSKDVNCQADFVLNADGAPTQLQRLSVTIPAESLKSHKDGMDKNAYKALKTSQHKTISFQLGNATVQGNNITASGSLTISGVTQKIELQATCLTQADKSIRCTGKKDLNMTDYQVEPPTFMFGSIKTGNAITLTFDVKLAAKPVSMNSNP